MTPWQDFLKDLLIVWIANNYYQTLGRVLDPPATIQESVEYALDFYDDCQPFL